MAVDPKLNNAAVLAQRAYNTAVASLATAQKAIATITARGGTPTAAQTAALTAAQNAVTTSSTTVKSAQMALNAAKNNVTVAAGTTGKAVSPAVDSGVKQQQPYNVRTTTGTGPTLSSSNGLLNIVGATALAAAAANPLGTARLVGSLFSSAKDILGVGGTTSSTTAPPPATNIGESVFDPGPPTQDTAVNPASNPSQFPAYDDDGNLQPGFAINEETGDTYYRGFELNTDQPVNPASNPSQFPAYDDDGNLMPGFAINEETGDTYYRGFELTADTPVNPASNPSQFPAYDDDGNLMPGFAINEETGDTYYRGFEITTDTPVNPAADPSQFPAYDDDGNLMPGFAINEENGGTYYQGFRSQDVVNQPVNPASDPSQFPAYDDDGNLQPGFAINDETGDTYYRGFELNTDRPVNPASNPSQFPAYDDDGNLQPGFAINDETGDTYYQGFELNTDRPVNPASDPSQFPAYDDDGNLQPGFAINDETGDTYYQGFERNTNQPLSPTADPSQFPAYDDDGNLQPGFAINDETGDTYYRGVGPPTQQTAGFDPNYDEFGGLDEAIAQQQQTATPVDDPYYGLTSEQLQQLGGADPTDPYIRARLGIPQLTGSPIAATPGFGTIKTGVPLIDNALGFLGGLFGGSTPTPPTPSAPAVAPQSDPSQFPAYDDDGNLQPGFAINEETGETYYQGFERTDPSVTKSGTTTGSPAPTPDTATTAQDAAALLVQDPALTDDEDQNLQNIVGAQGEIVRAEENIQSNNRQILANEESQAAAQEQQRQAQAIIDQNNAELADDTLPDSRRAELEANNAAQRASIAENAAVIDEAQTNIDNATANNERQADSILTNQGVIGENSAAFTANGDELGAPVGVDVDAAIAAAAAEGTDAPLILSPQEVDDEIAAQQAETNAQTAEDAAALYPGTDNTNLKNINEASGAIAQNEAGIANAQDIIAQNNAELADPNISDERRAELEANNASQENYIRLAEDNTAENELVIESNADAFAAGGGDPDSGQGPDAVVADNDPETAVDQNFLDANAEVQSETTLTILSEEETNALFDGAEPGLVNNFVEVDATATELTEEETAALFDGTDTELIVTDVTDLAEPVDPDADPELLGDPELQDGEITDLAEPVDPDADPELVELGDPDLQDGEITDLAEPVDPDADPELVQLGDPDLQDGEITDLAEPVDPDADPELVQLGGPQDDEELVQLSGPEDVNSETDPSVPQSDGTEGGIQQQINNQDAAAEAAARDNAKNQATLQARYKQPASSDWRVRLQLAPNADYLYKDRTGSTILAPLYDTDGVIFPYTPQIETSYNANYEMYDLTHSNFRGYFYKNSRVNDISIRATFTAQDTQEANYLLAVIHFFRSVTKMFYGAKDKLRGAPPPLTYLSGLGQYQFNQHPCVVSQFNYSLPMTWTIFVQAHPTTTEPTC